MELCHIVAVDKNNCIGKGNELPWHVPKDLQYFKSTTQGYPVIMGRKTFESIGRALPKRLNIILTKDEGYQAPEGVLVCTKIEDAIEKAKIKETDKIFILGGGEIFKKTLKMVDKVYLTLLDLEVENGDSFYPNLDETFALESVKKDFDGCDIEFKVYARV